VEFRVLGNDGSELLYKCVTVTAKSLGKSTHSLFKTQLLKWVGGHLVPRLPFGSAQAAHAEASAALPISLLAAEMRGCRTWLCCRID
jgi:hypothetical protein